MINTQYNSIDKIILLMDLYKISQIPDNTDPTENSNTFANDIEDLKNIGMIEGLELTVKGDKYVNECITLFNTYGS